MKDMHRFAKVGEPACDVLEHETFVYGMNHLYLAQKVVNSQKQIAGLSPPVS